MRMMWMLVLMAAMLLVGCGEKSDSVDYDTIYKGWLPYAEDMKAKGTMTETTTAEGGYVLTFPTAFWDMLNEEQQLGVGLGAYATSRSREGLKPGAIIVTRPEMYIVAYVAPEGGCRLFDEHERRPALEMPNLTTEERR